MASALSFGLRNRPKVIRILEWQGHGKWNGHGNKVHHSFKVVSMIPDPSSICLGSLQSGGFAGNTLPSTQRGEYGVLCTRVFAYEKVDGLWVRQAHY